MNNTFPNTRRLHERKISDILSGQNSPSRKKDLRPHPNKGRKLSAEHKAKLSKAHKGVPLSIRHRLALSNARRGVKNNLWKGGVSEKNRTERKNIMGRLEYKLWREAVFKRDNYTCLWCGIRSGKGTKVVLNADHIKPWALFPELRFALDNGRTLCEQCHRTTDTWGGRIKSYDRLS